MSKAEVAAQPEMTDDDVFELRRRYWESVAAIMRAKVDAYMMDPPFAHDEQDCGAPRESGYPH